jgi:predicted GNAT superfamily acetyltransferase
MTAPTRAGEIQIRHCHGLDEFKACYYLQQRIWGQTELDVPLPMFVVAAETGGQVLGAFDGEKMVGFTLAVVGYRDDFVFLHSHMTAVLEAYRDRGIGRRLKRFQRDDALNRGIGLVEWTFDPLEVKNAYLNLMRLGAIVRRYIPNCYGVTSSPLHGGMPTDRLVAEWWLQSPRVETLLDGRGVELQTPPSERVQILVPSGIPRLRRDAPVEALQVQSGVREQFQKWFGQEYVATAIEIGPEGGTYILEPWKLFADGGHLP